MFNIRAQSLDRDLAFVQETYGDIIDGMSFDFCDPVNGEIRSVGGPLGPRGLLLTHYEATEGQARIPGGDHLKFECPLNGTIVERQHGMDHVCGRGQAVVTRVEMSNMAFRPDGQELQSVSVNVPISVLETHLAQSGEPRPIIKQACTADERKSVSGTRLAELVSHILAHYQYYTDVPGRAELCESFLLDSFMDYLREAGHLDGQDIAGLRRVTLRATRDGKTVARAEDYIRAHYHLPLTMADIAAATGVSLRKLQLLFREHRRDTLSSFLTKVRLEEARRKLEDAAICTTVTNAALDCGIFHVGRFAKAYFEMFGEKPSDTIARTRH